jgi:MMP 1-O-methyltransferase
MASDNSFEGKSFSKDMQYMPRLAKEVGGWFSLEEGIAFHNHAKKVTGKGVIVEIGSWQGKSTIFLAKGSEAGKKMPVYAIDPHIGSEEHQKDGSVWTFDIFKKNMEAFNVDSLVRPIVKMSWEAAKDFNEKIEFLFIDGAHDYESVKKDIQDWFPRLVVGGTVSFHDSDWPGVMDAMKAGIYDSQQTRNIRRVKGTTFADKVEQNTAAERMMNQLSWLVFSTPIYWKRFRRKYLRRQKAATV